MEMGILRLIVAFLRVLLGSRAALAAEKLALRRQLAVLQRSVKRPKLRRRDRVFWVWLSRLWSGWRSALLIVQPHTVTRWHRQGFKLYGRRKSRKKLGRPKVDCEARDLIRQECLDHVIVLGEEHLRRILAEYFGYYHQARAHLSLERESPIPRPVCPPEQGKVVAKAYLGGLDHCYARAA
jgi:hypothetical protein